MPSVLNFPVLLWLFGFFKKSRALTNRHNFIFLGMYNQKRSGANTVNYFQGIEGRGDGPSQRVLKKEGEPQLAQFLPCNSSVSCKGTFRNHSSKNISIFLSCRGIESN